MSDKEFRFSVTTEGDSVVQTGSISTLETKYFGEYTKAIEYIKEEAKKFVNTKIERKGRIATIEDWQNKLNKPCQSMSTDFGEPKCSKQLCCFILNDRNFKCPEGRILKEKDEFGDVNCVRCGKPFDYHLTEDGLKCDGFKSRTA